MAKGVGNPRKGIAGPGRPKGVKNHVPMAVKRMVETALTNVGGVEYLEKMAYKEPKAFLALVGKVIPAKVEAELTVLNPDALMSRLVAGRQRVAELKTIDHDPGEVSLPSLQHKDREHDLADDEQYD